MFWEKFSKNQKVLATIIIILYLATRIIPAIFLPLIQDEALYTVMIEENIHHPTLIPTFMGEAVSWKPPLFFWTYGVLTRIPIINLEFTYRLPSIILGLISLLPLYLFLKKIEKSENVVLLSIFIFVLSFPSIYANSTVLLDTINFLFIISALYVYSEEKIGQKRFLIAGLISFAAFFLKQIIAFTIPALIIPYFYIYNKKELSNKLFLASLLAVPIAFLANHVILSQAGLSNQLYSAITTHVAEKGTNINAGVETFVTSIQYLLIGFGVWFCLCAVGLAKEWKKNLFMTIWFIPVILCLIVAGSMPWYFLPFMPAIAYFASVGILRPTGKETIDIFPILFTVIITIIILTSTWLFYEYIQKTYEEQKIAGIMASEKENVLVIGDYAPAITAYMQLNDLKNNKAPKDFGWIVFDLENESKNNDIFGKLIQNYSLNDGSITEKYGLMFAERWIFRKHTAIEKFDTIVVVGEYNTTKTLVYNVSNNIKIYN